ncbi:hypothetical protein [Tissierella sp.]|uniref:hypothetical protein n=1 Tax=Tissierella sp. TaxID=41274 RepID=UPI00285F9755|nr:hypothetical protein [Tissierella sp.]MDR7856614.1 hypothetical protein [Tissierella sp.]
MGKIFGTVNEPEFNIYYRTEDLGNTDFPQHENLDVRKPDAFVGLSNNIFLNPIMPLINADNNDDDLDWYE